MEAKILKAEAVVLKCIDFKEYNKILTLYSKEYGLIKLFVNLSKRTLPHLCALISPLTKAEFHFSKGKSDLFRFKDASLLEQHLKLRQNLSRLNTATKFITTFYKIQWPEEPNPALYLLLNTFLSLATTIDEPERLLNIFYLKLLKHEGILQIESHCTLCKKELTSPYRYKGECYCEKEAPPPSLYFPPDEEQMLKRMYLLRDSSALLKESTTQAFDEKIELLFNQNFSY